jgi:hypothetical protein
MTRDQRQHYTQRERERESGARWDTQDALEAEVGGVGAACSFASNEQETIAPHNHHLVVSSARWPLAPLRVIDQVELTMIVLFRSTLAIVFCLL